MKTSRLFSSISAVLGLLAFAGSGCSTPEGRIKTHQALFDAQPAETREKIRAGRIELGFTSDLVRLALGNPDRTYSRLSSGSDAEVWVYRDKSPSIGFGFSVGGGSGGASVGVDVGTDVTREKDRLRVIFEQGRVSAIERSVR